MRVLQTLALPLGYHALELHFNLHHFRNYATLFMPVFYIFYFFSSFSVVLLHLVYTLYKCHWTEIPFHLNKP